MQIVKTFGVSKPTMSNIVSAYVRGGVPAIIKINRNPNSNARRKIDGRMKAELLRIACGPTPEGRPRWTLRLLEKQVRLELDKPIERESIRLAIKNELRPHINDYCCIPPKENADFAAAIEDILDIYEMPYNPTHPVIYMDEKPYQCLGEARELLPIHPRDTKNTDSENVREGAYSIFVFTKPLRSWCHSSVRKT